MYYKDNYIEIRLGLGIKDFKSITSSIYTFILSKINEDNTKTIIEQFTTATNLSVYPSDGIYELEVKNAPIDPYTVHLNINDAFIKVFVNQVKDVLCNCKCKTKCKDTDTCRDSLNGNFAIKRQKLFNTTLILPNTIKPITYGQAPLTNPPLYNFFQLFFNETIVDKKVELGKEYFCFYSKGTVANNAELFNSIITGYYYGIYLYSKTLLLYNIPENLPLVKLEYTKKIDTIFDFKFIKNCLRCYTNNIDFNKIIEASFIGTDIIFTVPEQNNISRVINVYSSDLSGNGTLEEQISEYVNSLDYIKSEIDSDIWINYEENGTPPPPTPVDAVVSAWSDWTICNIDGTQSRIRTVITPAINGGNTPILTESRNCTYIPPIIPIDAVLSEWGDWGACIGNSSGASQIRTRTVLVPASNGGITGPLSESRPCSLPLEPTDAIVSAWSAWSECSLEGLQTRTRTIITPAANGGNTPVLTETQACVPILPPIDAVVSNWDPWSDCSIDGLQARDRYIITPASNGGNTPPLREIRNCTYVPPIPVDAIVSEWSDWSPCDLDANYQVIATVSFRTRTVTTPASNGGNTPLLYEERPCVYPTRIQIDRYFNDPCGFIYSDVWFDEVTSLYYASEYGPNLFTGYLYDEQGPTGQALNEFEWHYLDIQNGVDVNTSSEPFKTYSSCSASTNPNPIVRHNLASAPVGGCIFNYYNASGNPTVLNIGGDKAGQPFTIDVGFGGVISDTCGFIPQQFK